jgi:hypothetical protein
MNIPKPRVQRAGKAVQPGVQQVSLVEEPDHLACPECTATYFETVTANRYKKAHTVVIGQDVPTTGLPPFRFLRCLNCGQLIEPDYIFTADPLNKRYQGLLKELEDFRHE